MADYVLIVDDDKVFAQTVSHALRIDGISATIASTGADALALIAKATPALLLLDLRMPNMDGEHLLGILKSEPATANVPVIIISAKMNDTDARELTALGADGVISKTKTTLPQIRELVRRFSRKPNPKVA